MTRGRNTTLITARIPDRIFQAISSICEKNGMTNSAYVRSILEAHDEIQGELWSSYQDRINKLMQQR